MANDYLEDYRVRYRSVKFAEHAVGHVVRLLGDRMIVEIAEHVVTEYQTVRLKEGSAPKTINEEVRFLLRLLGDQGELIRSHLRKRKLLKLSVPASPGRAFSQDEKTKLMAAAREARSPLIYPALSLVLNAGMRDAEIRNLKWSDIDLSKRVITVGHSKTAAGTGRTIPFEQELVAHLADHRIWYLGRFGTAQPDWFVFPFFRPTPNDPSRPITTFKTAWTNVTKKAGVEGRWHDGRHTVDY